jgi:hypothetical protein
MACSLNRTHLILLRALLAHLVEEEDGELGLLLLDSSTEQLRRRAERKQMSSSELHITSCTLQDTYVRRR